MREVPGSNAIGDIAFFGGKACSTATIVTVPSVALHESGTRVYIV
jgi:hypothetical protein